MNTPKGDFEFGLGTDMELDFDTAYKNFEEDFEEDIDEAVNYTTKQSNTNSANFDGINGILHQSYEIKTPEPNTYSQHIEFTPIIQTELKQQNNALTQTSLLLLNPDKTPSKTQDHLISDNQSVMSGTFSEIIQKNATYFQHQQIQPMALGTKRPGTTDQPMLFPPLDMQAFPSLKSPASQTPMTVGGSPGVFPKSPETELAALPKDDSNKKFDLLSVKETSELLNFLTKLEKPEPAKKKTRKLSYDELMEKVDTFEKKHDAHKNKHKLSERKRRAVINERFNVLAGLIKLPRKNTDTNKKTRMTKHQQLQYVIEDLEEVTTQNAHIEDFLEKHQLLDHFELWKANLTK